MSSFIAQRTPEWFEARNGKATASRFRDVLATLKSGGESASRANYRAQLVVERLTGQRAERFESREMAWGTEMEDLARSTYELVTGNAVEEATFIEHPDLAAGASPDGLVGANGLIEIKAPNTAHAIEVMRRQAVPPQYVAQVQGQLWITGREWCDFVSFEPTLPANAQLVIVRVKTDPDYTQDLAAAVEQFLGEVDRDEAFVRNFRQPEEVIL